MSKAFTNEETAEDEVELEEIDSQLAPDQKNYMTPTGHAALEAELRQLQDVARPKVVEIVSWAAGNGDRSENADYQYGKRRLREIDRRLRYLSRSLGSAVIVDPRQQQALTKVYFGATVTYAKDDADGIEHEQTVKLVGVDEANLAEGKISWQSPVGRALLKAGVGDSVTVITPGGRETLDVLAITYRA